MMGKSKSKKWLAAVMTTALLAVPNLPVNAMNSSTILTKASQDQDTQIGKKDEKKITLITGDVVTVTELGDGKSTVTVEPAEKGDTGTRMLTIGKDTYVIPQKAMPYLAANKLDKQLFNITALLEDGYTDGQTKQLPIIVQYNESKVRTKTVLPAAPEGSSKTRTLESINATAVSADKKEAEDFWADITKEEQPTKAKAAKFEQGIKKIWLDGKAEATLAESVPQVGAPEAWAAGYDGKGTTVAVLDTGIDNTHPDIQPQLTEAVSFVQGEDAVDHHAHGTHVASTVLGTGAASSGKYKGVAPSAKLLVGKVLDNSGSGLNSWIIDGMEWASHKAKIVSMSIGSTEASDGTDPMAQAVDNLSEETGALFVIAAGNYGNEGTIGSPGAADKALTVGAVDKSDKLAYFSSQGPRIGDQALKPDLTAPGVDITAARSQYATKGSGSYLSMSGTSMATPHVAGAAAILSQRHPDWNGQQLKDALMSSTKELSEIKPYQGGTGRLDVAQATLGHIKATGSLDFGFYDYPHENDPVKEKIITYTNDSDQDVSVNVTASFKDQKGNDAPDGMIRLSADHITVPANGSAEVKVLVDPNLGALGSRYQGQVTATSDSKTAAHTAIGMIKEDERYSLTLKATDRDGSEGLAYVALFSENMDPTFVEVNGTKEVRLPKGTYSAMSIMDVDSDTDHVGAAVVGDPEVKLNKAQTVELDARKAREITAHVPKKAEPSYRRMELFRKLGSKTVDDIWMLPVAVDKMYAAPTKKVKEGQFELLTRWRLTKPVLTINFRGNELDDLPQAGSTPLKGNLHAKAVYAGKGAAEDYNRLNTKNKIVIVDRSDEVKPNQRALNALNAGAKMLIVANDKPTEISEYYANNDGSDVKLPVAAISGTEGDKVIKAARSGNLTLDVKGTPNTPYVYDLVDPHTDQIPKDLSYAPKTSELAKIDTRYHSDRNAPGGEFRYDFRPYSARGIGFLYKIDLPSIRTEWMSAQVGTSWYHEAQVIDSPWGVRETRLSYQPGERLSQDWFAPVVRPRLGDGFWVPYRSDNSLVMNIPAWADSGEGHTGSDLGEEPNNTQTLKLYQGDTLVENRTGQAIYSFKNYPAANTQYKLVSDATRDAKRWHTSTSTHTEWTFWSKAQPEGRYNLPLLSLDYNLDTDMNGDAIAGKTTKLVLSVVQIKNAIGNGKIQGASLDVSFNEGRTWKNVKVVRDGDSWTAAIKNPKKAGGSVSLSANAWDDAGNKINQDIIKAYGVR
ncbi:S8 family serine peptidase [Fictibacillus enclensis]|uniref:S8 family serine peptidase n=1 Tax=Fictibacillus enclensis TaxID=1017270 RepID=UPI0024BF42AF|nr:S8 family serine peptidase [Fictibacillus enclensis]WHY72044.1 S8 family serine peptidase [Fictibacillus enclensis]